VICLLNRNRLFSLEIQGEVKDTVKVTNIKIKQDVLGICCSDTEKTDMCNNRSKEPEMSRLTGIF
jgi:hypothetical protein